MPNSLITSDYLDRLSSHLQFESILKYVALPRLTIEAPTVRKKNKGSVRTQCHQNIEEVA